VPILSNPKHELFAQGLAAGRSQREAYIDSGYSATSARQNACKLLQRKADISQRVSELLRQRHDADGQAIEQAAAELAIDKTWVLRQLKIINAAGLRKKKDGTSENLAASNRATELIGKALGMFVDRMETLGVSLEDWLARLEEEDKSADSKKIPAPTLRIA
jgi:hypothetical protein